MADAVVKKLDMALDDIVEERKQQALSPTNGAGGKSRSTKRSERIAQVGPYPPRGVRGDDQPGGDAGRRVYVGNLSWSVQWQLLKDHMSAAGEVLHASVLESNGRSKGCGIVEYASEEDAARAIAMLNDTELEGRKIFVREDRETKPRAATSAPVKRFPAAGDENRVPNANGAVVTTTRVYVGNLSWNVKWQDLKDHMKVAGTVKHADVLSEANGRSKGCGLVEYETIEEAARAIATLNDTELDGRKIFVREDREPDGGSISSIAHRGASGGGRGFGVPRPAAPFARVPMMLVAQPQAFALVDGTSLYVGNLPWDVTWQILKDMFRTVGEVDRTEIAQFPDGRSRGFGIVRFVRPEDAARAIQQFNGSEMNGRAIEVRYDKGRA